MLFQLILAFIALPLLDLIVLLKIAELIGITETIVVVILTGLIGASLARREGLNTWKKFKQKISKRKTISSELTNGLLIIIGGAFLVTPGLITDSFGFLLIIPLTRKKIKKWLKNYLKNRLTTTHIEFKGVHK